MTDDLDLEAWTPEEPPKDFAEKVMARVMAERPAAKRRRPWRLGVIAAGAVSVAAAVAIFVTPTPHGEAIAKDRLEVSIGSRARAVLEPGAEVKWNGDDVEQPHGDVFYRVEPGARFVVHTPAGDVEVKGTCFAVRVRGEDAMNKRDLKSGVIGAGITALAFVSVYEGKVAVSHASEHADVAAGESAQVGAGNTHTLGGLSEAEKAADAAAAANGDAVAQANDNLLAQVSEYRQRLELIAAQKSTLEDKLKTTEAKLAAGDSGAGRSKPEYDLSPDDWKELAKNGEVKYRMPCFSKEGWDFPADKLNALGLAPQDAPVLKDAYQKSYDRVWAQVRPLCAQALGTTADVVDKIGPSTCMHLVYDVAQNQNAASAKEAHTQAAEIRAGVLPEPPADKQHPILKMFLAATDANKAFEQDLAKSLGPEEAYRLANAEGMCTQRSSWGGGVKRDASK